MSGTDHAGYKKIQVWIPESLWDDIESLNFPNQTSAVTEAFKALLDKSQNNPNEDQNIPRLTAVIEGLQLLLQEKDERVNDLKREVETLSIFAHYFKSLEYKRIEPQDTRTPRGHQETAGEAQTESTREAPRKTRTTQEKSGEKALIRKKCRYCGEEFEATNPRREYCKDAHRQAYFKQNQELKK